MIRFSSIEQSRQVLPSIIRDAQFTHIDAETKAPIYDPSAQLPVLEFRGTVKLHGCNAAIVRTASSTVRNSIHFQSRERILSAGGGLMGFYAHMIGKTDAIVRIFDSILRYLKPSDNGSTEETEQAEAIAIFGEWCGPGIQKGVAISKLPNMFVIFAVKAVYHSETAEQWLDVSKLSGLTDEKARIFNIMQFRSFTVVIDFNKQESLVEGKKKMDELTLNVEEECPVGKHFGVSGTGEGIVWQAVQTPDLPVFKSGRYTSSRFWFKTKGLKHAPPAKPKNLGKPGTDPKLDSFVESVVTPGRLEQGLQVLVREMLLPLEAKSIGAFIRWIIADVMKEEYDRIEQAGIDKKLLSGLIASMAKKWFLGQLKEVKG